jgi:hypothetical protein
MTNEIHIKKPLHVNVCVAQAQEWFYNVRTQYLQILLATRKEWFNIPSVCIFMRELWILEHHFFRASSQGPGDGSKTNGAGAGVDIGQGRSSFLRGRSRGRAGNSTTNIVKKPEVDLVILSNVKPHEKEIQSYLLMYHTIVLPYHNTMYYLIDRRKERRKPQKNLNPFLIHRYVKNPEYC